MTLNEILISDAEGVYRAADGLFRRVDPSTLDWKPQTGENWMTVGQLLRHCSEACGSTVRGFITGDWGFPADAGDPGEGAMMPQADAMPAVESVDEAIRLLADDKAEAMRLFAEVSEDRLANELSSAPWGGPERTLFQHCHEMIWHLAQHKGQLFYYLKLQGTPVNTMDLWMGGT
jgi:hypothetical protein